ncbi:hypothetical protein [Halosimplex marinum]|uniref:hypothetical protein n=1 Tax=Halosimplex marinum TaxID=3396620 RepID=UPI003F574A33
MESVTEVYRDSGDTQEVVVKYDGRTVSLGVSDPTVSRKKGGEAPVLLVPQSEAIEIQNRGNSNGISVDPGGQDSEIEEGYARRIQDTTVFQIGYQTRLKLTVEREERFGHVEGDVMFGGTKVDDAVVGPDARIGSDSGGDGGGVTNVDDSVVGPDANVGEADVTDSVVGPRASVGEGSRTDTASFCSTHQRTYSGEKCPECVNGGEANGPTDSSASGGPSTGSPTGGDSETKFCIYCGTSIPGAAQVCSSCGKSQPDV